MDVELAPNVYFKNIDNKSSLCIYDESEEIIAIDYDEVCNDQTAWLKSMQLVAAAIQYGPTVVKDRVKKIKAESKIPVGTLICNICYKKFVVGPKHPYVFIAKLNNNNYYEFQCSEECNKERKIHVYKKELGEEFYELWQTKFTMLDS